MTLELNQQHEELNMHRRAVAFGGVILPPEEVVHH